MFCVKTKLTNTNVWYIMHAPYGGYKVWKVWECLDMGFGKSGITKRPL